MSADKWRDEYFSRMGQAGVRADLARVFLRIAATMQRLAEAQCNGDYPADNGERPTRECSRCGLYWAPESLTKAGLCKDCRAEDRARAALATLPPGWTITTQGDPRGLVLRLVTPEGREIGVPA